MQDTIFVKRMMDCNLGSLQFWITGGVTGCTFTRDSGDNGAKNVVVCITAYNLGDCGGRLRSKLFSKKMHQNAYYS